MRFRFRLLYYMMGFSIGLMFLFFILNGKDTRCSYFPNARVLKNISSKPFHYSPEASKTLAEPWIDTIDIKNTMRYGDVDFDRSHTKSMGKNRYLIIGKTVKNVPITLEIINYDDRALLQSISKNP